MHLGAALLLTAFDRLPVLLDLLHGRALLIAKDVRVAADDLGRNVGDDVAQRERAPFGRNLRLENDLQQQVAQLFL